MFATFIPFTERFAEPALPNVRLEEIDRVRGVICATLVHLETRDPIRPHVFESTFGPLASGFEVGTFVLDDGSSWSGIVHVAEDVVRVRLLALRQPSDSARESVSVGASALRLRWRPALARESRAYLAGSSMRCGTPLPR